MVDVTETTIAMGLAALGIVGSIVWYGLAWYGIRTLQDLRDTVEQAPGGNGG